MKLSYFFCCNAIAIKRYESFSRILISEACQVASIPRVQSNFTNKSTPPQGSLASSKTDTNSPFQTKMLKNFGSQTTNPSSRTTILQQQNEKSGSKTDMSLKRLKDQHEFLLSQSQQESWQTTKSSTDYALTHHTSTICSWMKRQSCQCWNIAKLSFKKETSS